MYLAYFDESGDSGIVNSPTTWFVLSCVLVHDSKWMSTLDQLIAMRRSMRAQHGMSSTRELKSSDIRRGRGLLQPLQWSLARRMEFYENIMKYQRNTMTDTISFAVAINKQPAATKGYDARTVAWTFALQRVHNFCSKKGDERAMIFPDQGHSNFIRKLLRAKRRFEQVPARFGGKALPVPTDRIVEDPNERGSHDSYFVQLADFNAYAAHRSVHIDPQPSVSPDLWDLLGDRRLLAVNSLAGGPPGIKVYPNP